MARQSDPEINEELVISFYGSKDDNRTLAIEITNDFLRLVNVAASNRSISAKHLVIEAVLNHIKNTDPPVLSLRAPKESK